MSAPVIVVKLGGRTQADAMLPNVLAELWRTTGGRLVVVHGGGDMVSELQRARGMAPKFVGGRRVTGQADVEIIRMALSGLANKQLVAACQAAGVPALGISGEDGALLQAAPSADPALGLVGEPAAVKADLLALLLDAGYCPVISPVSTSTLWPGMALNVNGDDAAAAVAAALVPDGGVVELFFLADVAGVLADGIAIRTLDLAAAATLVANGTAAGGMAAKLDAARTALDAGVPRVRIGDLAALGDPSAGTTVVRAEAATAIPVSS